VDAAVRDAGLDPAEAGGVETAGIESPARRVAEGRADAGVALRATADRLGLAFASVGSQSVSLVGNPSRLSKPGVEAVRERAQGVDEVLAALPGYSEGVVRQKPAPPREGGDRGRVARWGGVGWESAAVSRHSAVGTGRGKTLWPFPAE
jgi:hypothetical protein